MTTRTNLQRGAIAAALALLIAGAAMAGETIVDNTRIEVRTAAGAIEAASLADLEVGEIRSFTTDRGSAGVAKRTTAGLELQVGGESFDVALPDVEAHGMIEGHGEHVFVVKQVIKEDGATGADGKKIKRVHAHADHRTLIGEGKHAAPSLSDPGNEDKRVLVMRTVEKRVETDL